jgi:UDP-GlcNAc:undecaprenyl-phosphate GlcNAc-1-phosphate transferase
VVYSLLGVSFLFGMVATWLSIAFARKHGLVSHPNPIVPQHTSAVAYLGGVGIITGVAVTFMLFMALKRFGFKVPQELALPSPHYILGSLLFLTLGVIDDLKVLKPAPKFALQLLVTVIVILSGLIGSFSGIRYLDMILSGLFVLTIINAMNFTDVCDGLLGGLAVIMLLFFAYFNSHSFPVTLIIAGACGGFLIFNLPPAKVFLGDAGSFLLGYIFVAEALSAISHRPLCSSLPAILLVLGVPLFELIFITVIRIRKGLPWWKGSPDHFALRLQARGLSRLQTDFIAWGAALLFCGAALMLPELPLGGQLITMCVVVILCAVSWRYLLRWEVNPRTKDNLSQP